jgi:oxygen-independent coproporphyrinogen-3 oxidase
VAGVYISYPFCAQKCSFCNFASGISAPDVRTRYEARLLYDLREYNWPWNPQTVYFGGGTPSLMTPELLQELMSAIPRSALTEVTLECAPGTVTTDLAHAWASSGVNRVSLGVQSFIKSELSQTGRRHSAETVEHDVALLRAAGIVNINIDLIAGLPGQTLESWEESFAWVEKLQPPHVSVYIFEIDEDSRLGKEVLLGGVRYGAARLPSEDLTAELYEYAVDRLSALGIERYEISNFARPSWESRHNMKYWQLSPYVGFGLDAHSFDGQRRWSTPDDLTRFFELRSAEDHLESDLAEEHFFVGLRLSSGIQPTESEWTRFSRPIEKWLGEGMLERQGERLRLTSRGVLVSNEILQEFINV